jgi:hypothetical protein
MKVTSIIKQDRNVIPVSKKTVHRRYAQCDEHNKAWFAVSATVGEPKGQNRFGIKQQEIHLKYRFCINGELQSPEYKTIVKSPQNDENERLILALDYALRDFRSRTNCHENEDLNCWRLAVVTTSPEFAGYMEDCLRERRFFPKDSPVAALAACRELHVIQIDPKDGEVVENEADLTINPVW